MSHLAFGHGEHFCVGSALARAEGRIAIEVLLERMAELRYADGVDPDSLPYERSYVLHGLHSLPIVFEGRRIMTVEAFAEHFVGRSRCGRRIGGDRLGLATSGADVIVGRARAVQVADVVVGLGERSADQAIPPKMATRRWRPRPSIWAGSTCGRAMPVAPTSG